jgi:lipid-binding SYLF domain-containing protein
MGSHFRRTPVPRTFRLVPVLAAAVALATPQARAENKEARRLQTCQDVLKVLLHGPEGIPRDLLAKAQCVAVVPDAVKFAFIVGGSHGKGVVVCRHPSGRGWGSPYRITMGGGSIGWQIGGEEADYAFLVMNRRGVEHLIGSQFKLGVDAAVAAGPVGRTASAATDATMHAEILSYSRTHGVFAGLALDGAVVKQDASGNEALYGHPVDPRRALLGPGYPVPPEAHGLVGLLDEASPRGPARE